MDIRSTRWARGGSGWKSVAGVESNASSVAWMEAEAGHPAGHEREEGGGGETAWMAAAWRSVPLWMITVDAEVAWHTHPTFADLIIGWVDAADRNASTSSESCFLGDNTHSISTPSIERCTVNGER